MEVTESLLTAILGGLSGATILAFLNSYFGERGKHLATTHDIEQLQQQLCENTEIAKSIEQSHSRADVLWRAELEYRERQLAELYGPAYGYVKTSQELYDLWKNGKTPEINLTVKRWLTEQNKFMRELLISKAHLIEGSRMPECMSRFATSTLIFDFYASPSEEGQVPEKLKSDARTEYPNEFDQHIIETTERLKGRIDQLHARHATPLQT